MDTFGVLSTWENNMYVMHKDNTQFAGCFKPPVSKKQSSSLFGVRGFSTFFFMNQLLGFTENKFVGYYYYCAKQNLLHIISCMTDKLCQ